MSPTPTKQLSGSELLSPIRPDPRGVGTGARNGTLLDAKQLDSRHESGASIKQRVDAGERRKSGKLLKDDTSRESEGSAERGGGRTDVLLESK